MKKPLTRSASGAGVMAKVKSLSLYHTIERAGKIRREGISLLSLWRGRSRTAELAKLIQQVVKKP